MRKKMAKELDKWELDQLPTRIPALNAMLHSEAPFANTSIVVYVHCEAGMDRTGEISGSYYMQYLNWSFTKALDYNNHVESRNISTSSMRAMQWFCYYLQYALDYPAMSCLP